MVAVSPAEWVPVRPPAASVAVVVVPDDGADPEMHSMLAQFETVIVTHDARAGAAALAALSASDAPEADMLRPARRSPTATCASIPIGMSRPGAAAGSR
jgi:hypothetical protein